MSAPFVHTPRPAQASETYRDQRYFGGRIENAAACASACARVYRRRGDAGAEVSLATFGINGLRAEMAVDLPPSALRELARCLIDAAADIESEQSEDRTATTGRD